ncbi:kinase-like protein [Phanerochaete sordida]|uniref:non-specific serine/threonine protein kinase n=1 Tax=Phanerochaete sordida TaxID=48140 RepID=A0A9P3G7G2_9APHY|nr:kinase-like protein [Phanerochaete sordida]
MSRNSTSATSVDRPGWVSREEPVESYGKESGFLPVAIGQELGGYAILRKLGCGVYSTVWLAQRKHDGEFAALKVMSGLASKHFPELDFLQRMRNQSPSHPGSLHVTRLIDHFHCSQEDQDNLCLALEPLSESLHSFSKRWGGARFPSGFVRRVMRQVVQGIDFMHTECNIIHTDIKPDNVMLAISPEILQASVTPTSEIPVDVTVTPAGKEITRTLSTPITYPVPPGDLGASETWKDVQCKLADFGVSCWADKTEEHLMELIQAPALRAPEVCLGAGWGKPADIWSIGCMAYQLMTGSSLIHEESADVSIPNLHAIFFGDCPQDLVQRGKYSHMFFNEDGTLKYKMDERVTVAEMVKRRAPGDADLLIDFLNQVFVLDPALRPTARDLLEHEWLRP